MNLQCKIALISLNIWKLKLPQQPPSIKKNLHIYFLAAFNWQQDDRKIMQNHDSKVLKTRVLRGDHEKATNIPRVKNNCLVTEDACIGSWRFQTWSLNNWEK